MTLQLAERDIREGFAPVRFDRPLSRIISGAKRRRRRKRATFTAIPVLGLVAAGGSALLRSDKIFAGNVYCYNSADRADLPFGGSAPQTTGESPEELCAEVWEEGILADPPPKGDAPYPVPPLTACAVPDPAGAVIGVFPTDDETFCSRGPVAKEMHLSEVPEGYTDQVDRYIAMRKDITARTRDAAVRDGGSEQQACLNESAVTALVRTVLEDHGYTDWNITISHSKTDAPCWMDINFDNTSREVIIYSTQRGIDEIWIDGAGVFPDG